MDLGLVEMLRYNKWATLTLLEACRGLTDEQLDARAPGTSGSVRDILMHVVGGQQTFVRRVGSRKNPRGLNRGTAWPGFAALLDAAARSSDDLVAIAAGLDPESEVDLPYLGKKYRYPTRFFLVHAMEHGVEHRTEIKVILGGLGIETPDLDGWGYCSAAGYGQEV